MELFSYSYNYNFNGRFNPRIDTNRTFLSKIGALFSIFKTGQGRPLPLPLIACAPALSLKQSLFEHLHENLCLAWFPSLKNNFQYQPNAYWVRMFERSILFYWYCLGFISIVAESKSEKNTMTETTLTTILSKYELKDLYNTKEFKLSFQCLLDKLLKLGS